MYTELEVNINDRTIIVYFKDEDDYDYVYDTEHATVYVSENEETYVPTVHKLVIKDSNRAAIILDWIDEFIVKAMGDDVDYERPFNE